ncbi:MAG: hypothetical protein IKJ74_01600 [Clostridia bacterium]|nr:hypothetical protein [Clostridia bacterium]
MKKILSFFAICLALAFLMIPVAAEKAPVRSVTVEADFPVAGKKPSSLTSDCLKIVVDLGGEGKELSSADLEFALVHAGWYEIPGSGEAEQLMKENDTFVSGRTYLLRYKFDLLAEYSINASTPIFFNKENFSDKKGEEIGVDLFSQNSSYVLDFKLTCTPADIAPKVTLKAEGLDDDGAKEFDGEAAKLTAKVEKIDGVTYRYEWFRDGALLEEAKEETLPLRNVADSGKYHCKVYAFVGTEPADNKDFTETVSQQVTVKPRAVTVQIENAEKNLFDPDPAFTYTVMGDLKLPDQLTGTPERVAGEDIGNYAINGGTLCFPEEVAGNYTLEILPGSLTVLKVDDLPVSAVASLADLSYITGESGAKIRVSASKGAMPQGSILKLSTPDADAKTALEEMAKRNVLKGFTVSIVAEDGSVLSLPKHAFLKIQIPLTAEEAKLATSMTAGLFTDKADTLTAELVENGGVNYFSIQLERLGTVVLFEGDAPVTKPAPTPSEKPAPAPEKKAPVVLWVIIVILTVVAVSAIVFALVWTKKMTVGTPKEKPASQKRPLTREEAAERARKRRIAQEINAMPPLPKGDEDVKIRRESPAKPKSGTVSFEDLED